ncbi:hypothetical protein FB451DRAFT_1307685 [Mycena latifolia]|nr:hypothetical protein FB451DRAFT_1307685 [Mycena latifolia]
MPKGSSTLKDDILFTGFGSHSNRPNLKVDDSGQSESDLDLNPNGEYQDPKICLDLLKTMIGTVLDTEFDCMLLTPGERSVLLAFQRLSVHAQNLFVFLVIHPTWHRLPSLKLVEIPWGDVACAITELVRPLELTVAKFDCEPEVKPEPANFCVKTEETSDFSALALVKKEEPLEIESPFKLESLPATIPGPSNPDVKFDVNATAGPSTLLPPEPNPPSLCITDSDMTLRQLLEYMGPDEQRIIGKDLKIKAKKKTDLIESILSFSSSQTTLADYFGKGKVKAGTEKPSSQEERLRAMIMKKLQKLVRVNQDVYDILRRVHIIYFRSTKFPIEIIPRPLRHLQRNYPEYVCARNVSIWPTRKKLIEYEDSLTAEAVIDGVLPSAVFSDAESPKQKNSKLKGKSRAVDEEDEGEVQDKKAAAVRKAKATKTLFDEVYSRWPSYLSIKLQGILCPGLERFEAGYVLTRVLHKSVKAFKLLENCRDELAVYDVLLDQKVWCSGLRGPWHIRRTAIHVAKMKDRPDEGRLAIKTSTDGMTDPATALVYCPTLIKNLVQLQKRLQIPVDDQVEISEAPKVAKVVLEAVRIVVDNEKKKNSLWRTQDDEVVPIEKLVSQHYEETGFGSISAGSCFFTTLFTLLFWDIIFMPVDGAFDTHFQTCPLDLCEDTFVTSRSAAITHRLSEIEDDKAVHYLRQHDTQYRPAQPCAVGARWDLCARKKLIGIAKCIPPKTLAMICQMFCEDYAGACVGAPDLIAWNARDKDYKLVHIKGPGYPGRQSQKAWRDVLARVDTEQEVCEVVEPGKKKRKGKKKAADSDSDSASEDGELEPESEEECESQARASGSKKRPRDSDEEEEYQPKNSKRRKTSG